MVEDSASEIAGLKHENSVLKQTIAMKMEDEKIHL